MAALNRRTMLTASAGIAASAAAVGTGTAAADVAPSGSIAYPTGNIAPPKQRINWRPDPNRAALLVHDMQHYFVKVFDQHKQPYLQLRTNIRKLLDTAHAKGIPVCYSGQPGGMTPAQRGLGADFNGPGMPDDDTERAIDEPIKPARADEFVTKWRDNAFFDTNLSGIIRWHGRDQLLVCGIYALTGVTTTAADAYYRDIQPFLISDAIADRDAESHQNALDWAAKRTSRTMNTESVLSALG